jgi:cation transport protein ChaC
MRILTLVSAVSTTTDVSRRIDAPQPRRGSFRGSNLALRYHAAVGHPLWIFGYGSLVWRPAFPYEQRRPAFVRGYARRFWQASTDHRGTPEAPGRVVTLLRQPDAVCWGMAYQVSAELAEDVLRALDHREQDGYQRVRTRAVLPAHASHEEDSVDVIVYVAGEDNPSYLGPAPIEEIAAIIRMRHGPSGSNREYVLSLARALVEMDAEDPHVFELARLLER